MTRNSNTKIFTPSTNPERQFRARKDTSPISVHNIYSFYESEQSDAESEEIGEVDIETLTMEQYLALDHGDTRRGVRKPEIEGNVDFEIKGLTTTRALLTIQEMVDHSHKWHDEERRGEYNSNRMNTIIDKLKILNHDMRNLNENVHTIKGRYVSGDEMHYLSSEDVKFVKTTEYNDDTLEGTPGIGTPKPISIVIEMADMSMQYPKEIVKNVLVKIDKFIFPMRKITRYQNNLKKLKA
ncbi:hypothetical protein Tco_0845350 [Tanacetum coccineum]